MPETDVVPCIKVNVDDVIVEASIFVLKLIAIFWFKATSIAALAGTGELTMGGVTNAAVVKLHT